ncbi:anhydro-N-acetylmuramic acid kinase [Psychrobacter lutiphocae]|uniref:anhydro-N-acetylmuramic acid kinase n=1 Tax=Psychrobacter lutiphocae TaxID=540500 RepID=UPI000368B051|nr:anhydro-N-acetylmuramic acid kinase [Psychrobacter lutiphocae]
MPSNVKQSLEHSFEYTLNETLYNSFDQGYYIGMMSGTSLDGMDAVICQFDNDATNKIVATHSKDFPDNLREVLLALCVPNGTSNLTMSADKFAIAQQPQSELEWFGWASREYAEFASHVVNELLEQADIAAESILAIGCHGQTVRHRPNLGFTLQLVDPNIIAERTGISVVTDFRRRDMAVGGQGAPLAPAFHLAQFAESHQSTDSEDIIVVNLGGIANITVLPSKQIDKVTGYDTGPANILLDAWYQHHYQSHIQGSSLDQSEPLYDKSGIWAQSGEVNSELLELLLSHPYFAHATPKSTGREDFNLNWLQSQIKIIETKLGHTLDIADVQATLTALTAQSLADAIKQEAINLHMSAGDIIVCGGGAYNVNLLAQIAKRLPNWEVATSAKFGIAPTWVEAMAFAWLARQTIMGETGNLPAVTGANKAVVLGQVCFA